MNLYKPTYDFKELREIVILNLLTMLQNRNWITQIEKNKFVKDIKKSIYDSTFKLDNLTRDTITEVNIYFVEDRSFFRKKSYDKKINMDKIDIKHIILVNSSKLLKVNKALKNKRHIEIWQDTNFITDIIQHVLVPKHELLSKVDRDKFTDEMGIKLTDLAEMFKTDRIARYYNAQVGDIFKITRKNKQSGIETFWRLIVPI